MIREHRIGAALGIVMKPLAAWNARAMAKAAPEFVRNIALLRAGAPRWSPLRWLESQVGAFEFLIHHEDVRRAQPGWEPRDLTAIDKQLWTLVTRSGRFPMARSSAPVMVVTPDGRTFGAPGGIRVVGEPMELLLYLTGRTDVARVD